MITIHSDAQYVVATLLRQYHQAKFYMATLAESRQSGILKGWDDEYTWKLNEAKNIRDTAENLLLDILTTDALITL